MISSFLRRRALPFLFVVLCLPLAALKAQPVITLSSSGYSVELGGNVTIDGASVSGQSPFTYQWVQQGANNTVVVLHDGATANGSTLSGTSGTIGTSGIVTRALPGMLLAGATAADAGAYAIEVTDANGASITSAWITLTVKAPAAPTITSEPFNVTVVAGNNATLGISATGSYPRTYQWYKGTVGSGSAIAGATSNPYTITGALAGDAGSYYVTVSNAYGSDTSTAATLTVNPATAITFPSSVTPATVYVGQPVTARIYLSTGSSPITYQWQKDGTAIAGATTSSYSIASVAQSDAGTYTLVATNAAGTATSPGLTLTVLPAVAVAFPSSVTPVTITAGQSLNLNMSATAGSPTITYQWQKDGVPIAGATYTSYFKSLTTTADSGSYTVIGTNPAGSTTSPAIQVTVNPPLPPTITTPPVDVTIAQGNTARFSVVAGGSPPFTYQWLKNGSSITGATYSSYSITAVQPADAGSYSVTVSNAAGNITSAAATLTVLPPVAPSFTGSVGQQSVTVGSNLTLSAPSLTNYNNNGPVGPYTYQWFKDGTAISGATAGSYTLTAAQLSDAGTYAVAVTNAGGTAAAPPTEVTVTPVAPTGAAWLDAAQQGSIVYFLFASHIERYDLAADAWLPSTNVTQTATAFCVAPDGVYVGFGRALAKFPLDLSSQTTLANLGDSITALFSLGNYVYAAVGTSSYTPIYPVDRTSGAVGTASSLSVYANANFLPVSANKIYSAGNSKQLIVADGTGKLSQQNSVPYYYYPAATRGYLMPDQQHMADNGGTVFGVNDARLAGTFGGAFTDMAFLADGTPVVLRKNVLATYSVGGMKETAHTTLAVTGSRVFASGSNVLVFYPGAGAGNSYIGLTEVAASSIGSGYTVAPAADASHLAFAATATLQDAAGIVYLYDPAHENLFRWSPTAQAYLAPIPLGGAPTQLMYSGALNAIYCVYRSGRVTKIDLGAASLAEQPFSAFPDVVNTATGADNYLYAVIQDASDSGEQEITLDARTGAFVAMNWGPYYAASYAWSAANQTVYGSQNSYAAGSGHVQPITSAGLMPPSPFGLSGGSGNTYPSPDGTRLLAGGGQVYNAFGLNIGVLGNSASDATWLGTVPVTMRSGATTGTEIQAWSPANFILAASAELPGTPVRLLTLGGNQLLAITQVSGVPTFTVLNASLQRVSTTAAASSSGAPTFVTQSAPSLTVFNGTAVALAVDTNGSTPQTFQWYKNGSAIAGATNAALSLSAVSSADAANYYVVATNGAGAATSGTTSLAVAPALAFTTQPQSQVLASGSATFTAAVANDTGASYQWYFNRGAVAGATSNTLVISPISSSNWGTYILKVSNTGGAIYSSAATLLPPAPVITAQPQSATLNSGGNLFLSVSAQYATNYQWYLNGQTIPWATYSTYSVTPVTSANAGTYTVVVTGQGGSTTSAAATVSVAVGPPTITTQPQSVSAAYNTSVMLYVVGTNVTSYQWYFNGAAIAGATSSNLSLANFTSANVGNYTVVLTGPGGTITSNVASVSLAGPPPTITSQPQSTTVNAGSSLTLSVTGSNVTKYQWYRNGVAISGATGATLALGNVSSADAGTYTVALTGLGGTLTSNGAVLTVLANPFAGAYFGAVGSNGQWALWVPEAGNGKFLSYVPNQRAIIADARVAADGTITLLSIAGWSTGSPMPLPSALSASITSGTVTGDFNGTLSGAIDSGTAATAVAGFYRAVALNGAVGESDTIVGAGGRAFVVWFGAAGVGMGPDSATGTLTSAGQLSATSTLGYLVTMALDANAKSLTETFTGSSGAVISLGGLAAGAVNSARLLNLSSRADVGSGGNVLISGFSLAGTGTKGILVRGIGPGLKNYGVTNALAAPKVTFNDGNGVALWSGTSWGGGTTLIDAFNAVGAFPLDATSADAAHTFVTAEGRYTATVASADSGTGIALAEVYDTDGAPTPVRLVNLSARANVESGAGVLTAGLVVGGNGPETVLLRGIGPALKDYGVPNYLAAPQLTLFDGASHQLAVNAGWTDGGGVTSATMSKVSAFALTPGSADCVIIATLMPGRYTVQVSSRDTNTGVALVEVYEVR